MNKLKEIKKYNEKRFEDIKHINEFGNEYWTARELQGILEYKEWRKFEGVINKAKEACKQSDYHILDHFVGADKIVKTGAFDRKISDYHLSRYACYLIVQNGDPRKEVIALGQTYFAIQTRKQEILEQEYEILSDDEKRLYQRNLTRRGNYTLQQTALQAGVKDMASFHNAGYKGLYNGETADYIFKRKGLRYREDILDNMGEDELVANLFRINQTKQKIQNEKIKGEIIAKAAHFEIGKKVRKFISDNGGTMPEDLPTPSKSLKEIEMKKRILENCFDSSNKEVLLSNLDKLTTTELGSARIKRNLDIETDDVVLWCKNKIKEANSIIKKEGKNWYITNDNITITVNASSYGIITAHKEKD